MNFLSKQSSTETNTDTSVSTLTANTRQKNELSPKEQMPLKSNIGCNPNGNSPLTSLKRNCISTGNTGWPPNFRRSRTTTRNINSNSNKGNSPLTSHNDSPPKMDKIPLANVGDNNYTTKVVVVNEHPNIVITAVENTNNITEAINKPILYQDSISEMLDFLTEQVCEGKNRVGWEHKEDTINVRNLQIDFLRKNLCLPNSRNSLLSSHKHNSHSDNDTKSILLQANISKQKNV